jgi:hypothetical protein
MTKPSKKKFVPDRHAECEACGKTYWNEDIESRTVEMMKPDEDVVWACRFGDCSKILREEHNCVFYR